MGYFPTYAMGNMIGWQIWRRLQQDIPETDGLMEKGNFAPILAWLTEKVYSQGKRFSPRELVMRVTGRPMETTDYVEGMRGKYGR